MISRHIMISIKLVLVSTILLGLVYPFLVFGIAQGLFHNQANGSFLRENGHVIGSVLIGQRFIHPGYFHSRPSAAGAGYDASASSGSNLGPTSLTLINRVRHQINKLVAENPGLKKGDIPVDMVTTSASGLDPDISPANAYAQAARVASARGLPIAKVQGLIRTNITRRQFGVLGEPRVNVLRLNMALDVMAKQR